MQRTQLYKPTVLKPGPTSSPTVIQVFLPMPSEFTQYQPQWGQISRKQNSSILICWPSSKFFYTGIFLKKLSSQVAQHYGCFLGFVSKIYFKQISILGTNEQETTKNKGAIVILTFRIEIVKVHFFFQIFYTLVPKIEILLKYFLDNIVQMQPLCQM